MFYEYTNYRLGMQTSNALPSRFLKWLRNEEICMLKNKPTSRKAVLAGLVVLVTTLACGGTNPFSTPTEDPVLEPTVVVQIPEVVSQPVQMVSEDQVLIDLYARVNPSVVNITIYGSMNDQIVALGQGSGFIYDTLGNIITNAHVVHGATEIEVTFFDGLVRAVTLVGEDLNSDLAVVHVDLPEGVNPLPLGEMSDLAVGQTVVAIGNPFGLQGTLTRGIISALGRTIPALTIFSIPQAIQTDAAINPGNSGGPLLNLDGEVIGVNAQIETDGTNNSNIGVGFAIPVSIIRRVVPELIANGEYIWPYLGISGGDVIPLLVEAMSLPVERGAYVAAVVANTPASRAGLQGASGTVTLDGRTIDTGGDVITAIDGTPVLSFDDLLLYLSLNTAPDQTVTLTILRDGEMRDVPVTLVARPST
jgi:S1-C subfamily serine protease